MRCDTQMPSENQLRVALDFHGAERSPNTTIVSYATTIKGPIVIESHFQTICEQERITNV